MMKWGYEGSKKFIGGNPVEKIIQSSRDISEVLAVDLNACNNYSNGLEATEVLDLPALLIFGELDKMVNIEVGKVSDLLYDLMTSTKAKKFRAGFIKTDGSYRVGKFDLLNRSTWRQTDGTMYKRKGKKRTTDADEYILAHDLEKKAPRNISVKRLKWFSVGKKVYKINRLEINDDITIVMFDKVKFNALKTLMTKGDINE